MPIEAVNGVNVFTGANSEASAYDTYLPAYENIVNQEFGKYFKHSYSWFLAILFSIFGESYLLAA